MRTMRSQRCWLPLILAIQSTWPFWGSSPLLLVNPYVISVLSSFVWKTNADNCCCDDPLVRTLRAETDGPSIGWVRPTDGIASKTCSDKHTITIDFQQNI